MNHLNEHIDARFSEIYRKVVHAHRSIYRNRFIHRLIRLLLMGMLVLALLSLLHLMFEISQPVRWGIWTGWVGGFLLIFAFQLFPLLQEIWRPSREKLEQTARLVGIRQPGIGDALIDFIQLYRGESSNGSPAIREKALQQLAGKLNHFSCREESTWQNFWRKHRVYVASLAVYGVLAVVFSGSLGTAFQKTVFPWNDYTEPIPLQIQNLSGNMEVLRNDPVTLQASIQGVVPDRMYLVIVDSTRIRESSGKKGQEKIPISLSRFPRVEYQIPHVNKGFTYYFLAELDQWRRKNRPMVSAPGKVVVRQRPLIRNLQIKVVPPRYTHLEPQLLPPNDGEITALRGSQVHVRIEADKNIDHGFILFSDSSRITLKALGNTATTVFQIKQPLAYTIHIFDREGIENDEPVQYHIFPIADEFPYAEIKQPEGDVDLENELKLPLFVEYRDDFGFRKAVLKGVLIRGGSTGDSSQFEMKLPFKLFQKGKAFTQIMWDLTPFYMVPDDYIEFFVEVWDNDPITGPKKFRTSKHTIRLPSLLEILDQAEEKQKEQLEQVKDVAGNTEELRKKLEEISREMKKNNEMNWERKQEIKEQIEKQKKAMEKLAEIQKELEEISRQLDRNRMLSPETLEKYFELQKMFEELASPQLKEAMEKLQQALEHADPREIQKAMKRLQFSVEQFEKNVERTYELMKQVMLEQKMDELVNLADKMNQEQGEINQKLAEKDLSQEEMNQLAKKEENLQKEADYLEKEMEALSQEYRDMLKQFSEELQKVQQFMQENQMQASMQQMSQQLSQGNQQQAQNQGQNLKAQLDMLQNMLQSLQQSMQQQQKQELMEAMQRVMEDMLTVSFRQEKLAREGRKLHAASARINRLAQEQNRLEEATRQIVRQLVEISNKTFFIPPEMSQQMAQILSDMERAIHHLENRNPRGASGAQQKAMGRLNQAMLSMQNAMNQLAQSSSATGFQQFMQQLQQMANQQGQLNQQSMQMFQMGQQGRLQLSPDDLARLAAQQEMIRQSLDQLNQQMGNRRDVLGRLGDLGKEMEEVVKDLRANRLDKKVLERQERILSRLLDAQRSIREKEYSKKRKAEWEKQVLAKSPPELQESLLRQQDRLRKELLNSLQEGYRAEYREFIKLYFENLSRTPFTPQ